jgi:hypothetical protein
LAHIFSGDLNSLDLEVLEALKTLPDTYWVFAGFHVGREVDWFVVRVATPTEHSALILTELKRYEYGVRGVSQDAAWERQSSDGVWHPIDSGNDRNPYWQAVNTANALKSWLWNNQRLYFGGSELTEHPEDDFGVWPNVLILSPPGVRHFLPLRPTSRYGAWVYDLDRWLGSLQTWRPRKGVGLSEVDLQHLVEALGLKEIWAGSPNVPASAPVPITSTEAPTAFLSWLADLSARIDHISARLDRLEHKLFEQPHPDNHHLDSNHDGPESHAEREEEEPAQHPPY